MAEGALIIKNRYQPQKINSRRRRRPELHAESRQPVVVACGLSNVVSTD